MDMTPSSTIYWYFKFVIGEEYRYLKGNPFRYKGGYGIFINICKQTEISILLSVNKYGCFCDKCPAPSVHMLYPLVLSRSVWHRSGHCWANLHVRVDIKKVWQGCECEVEGEGSCWDERVKSESGVDIIKVHDLLAMCASIIAIWTSRNNLDRACFRNLTPRQGSVACFEITAFSLTTVLIAALAGGYRCGLWCDAWCADWKSVKQPYAQAWSRGDTDGRPLLRAGHPA